MFISMKIPTKLALSFFIVCVSAAAMMIVFFSNVTAIRSASHSNNLSQTVHAKVLTLETALLRQNSQMRGFLVTADETYLKSYDEAHQEYDKASTDLETLLTEPALRAALLESRAATLAWRKNWGDRMVARVRGGQRDAAQADVRAAGKAVLTSAAVLPLRKIRDRQVAEIEQNSARQERAIASAITVLVVGGIALIGIAIVLAFVLSKLIAQPVSRLTATMGDLAAGRHNATVPDVDRSDELGDMARAVLVFRDAAVAKDAADKNAARADAEQQMVVETVSNHLAEVAQGNLTAVITQGFPQSYEAVKTNFNEAVIALREMIASVRESTATIRTGSDEIAKASEDLARRTESNAASLEETAAAVIQMDDRLKATSASASSTADQANGTMTTVANGRATAEQAVQAMSRVSDSAKGIDSVIEGLDKIAFQTRVLAMNAAVEAGRAGDAGRGFAVVADLVSALAMRAEEEAARARNQLSATQTDIVTAVEAVHKVDAALADISTGVVQVNDLLCSIAADNLAQSRAISEISAAIGTMDRGTQQNAAMVEETSAAARNLASEVNGLAERASRFNLDGAPKHRARTSKPHFSGQLKHLSGRAVAGLRPSIRGYEQR
ncbi:methyl-accepting chemotaxis protein [Sphingobium sp. BS19]|nr:methyl-accepting chemotaxis protein [Sphingobium sp. BS19]GLJ00151.1 methyl-accepting chemotaxis protein [Sphingobium sp. BS19]